MVDFRLTDPSVPFPTEIETNRLLLKRLGFDVISTKQLFDLYKSLSEEATQHVTFNSYNSINEAHAFINRSIDEFEAGDRGVYAVIEKASEEFIGTADFSPRWNRSLAESGIFLLPEYWGNGYSVERGEAMLELAFEQYELDAWLSRCSVKNSQSARAIQKYVIENGGKRVGVIPNQQHDGELIDCLLFSLRKQEYDANNNL